MTAAPTAIAKASRDCPYRRYCNEKAEVQEKMGARRDKRICRVPACFTANVIDSSTGQAVFYVSPYLRQYLLNVDLAASCRH